jgi:CRISPR-associated protein Cmr6
MRRSALGAVKSMSGTHAGLWLDKFLVEAVKAAEKVVVKKALLLEAAACGVPEGYADAFKRWRDGLEADAEAGRMTIGKATVQGRMIVGLGAKGPAEAGIRLDRTWGTPMIPGSSLKGLAAASAHLLANSAAWEKPGENPRRIDEFNDFDWLFGSTDHQGAVVFHDAWWVPENDQSLPLDLDVMTVHHPEYYGGKDVPPSDMDSPVPVYFLTSRGSYLIALEGEPAWCEAALRLLELGLRELGIGAKTAAGYGRATLVKHVTKADQLRDQQAAQAARATDRLNEVGNRFNGEASHCEAIASTLLALRDELGNEAVLKRARELFAGEHRKVWKNWLEKPKRKEHELWLKKALSAG